MKRAPRLSDQGVQTTLPDLISKGPDGYYTMNYAGLTPYIVKALQDIATITGAFKANLVAWLGSSVNGIQKIIADLMVANTVRANQQLCVGTTCVTPEQFQAMVAAAAKSSSTAPTDPATSSATLTLNGLNPATWTLNTSWQDNLGALFTHDGQSETIYSTSTVDSVQAGTTTLDYWAVVPSTQQWFHATRAVVIPAAANNNASSSPSATANDNQPPLAPTGTTTAQ